MFTDGGDFALVVGIDKYGSGLHAIKGPPWDADHFIQWLNADHSSADVREGNLLKRVNFIDSASLRRAIIDLKKNAARRGGGRRLYIFYAGHGFGSDFCDAGAFTSDYEPDWDGARIDLIKTADLFRASCLFKEVVVFMDCCRTYDNRFVPTVIRWDLSQGGSCTPGPYFYCLACGLGEKTYEIQDCDQTRGIFSLHLLQALNGAVADAIDERGRVTAQTLKEYLNKQLGTPRYDPSDDSQVLKDFVLATGFTPSNRTLEVVLSEPSKGFSLFSGELQKGAFSLLRWPRVQKQTCVEVTREGEPIGVILVVPEIAAFDQNRLQRSVFVLPDEKVVKI